jgi:hypothetical protein
MNILYRCDQCTHEEWRQEGQEPWLCVVCGYMRWEAIASEAPVLVSVDMSGGCRAADGEEEQPEEQPEEPPDS